MNRKPRFVPPQKAERSEGIQFRSAFQTNRSRQSVILLVNRTQRWDNRVRAGCRMSLPPDWQKPSYPLPPFPVAPRIKRKVFVSYHHERDQFWYDHFTNTFSDENEVFRDQSLDDEVDSEDLEYVNRVIREDFISGSSITIVLCGAETWKRRFIDWEIASTLHYEHALLGILIPGTQPRWDGKYSVPDRLNDNIQSGYAGFANWPSSAAELKAQIEAAINKSIPTFLIRNERDKMKRNLL